MAEAARGHACGAPSLGPENSSDCGHQVAQVSGRVLGPFSDACVCFPTCQLACREANHPPSGARVVASLLHLNHREAVLGKPAVLQEASEACKPSVTFLTSFSSGLASLHLSGAARNLTADAATTAGTTDMVQNASDNVKVADTAVAGPGLCCSARDRARAINEDDQAQLGSERENEREQEDEPDLVVTLGLEEEEGLCSSHHHSHDDMSCSRTEDSDNDKKRRRTDRYDSSESSDSGVASLGSSDASSWSSTSDITEPASPASSAASLTSQPSPLSLNGLLSSPRYARSPSPPTLAISHAHPAKENASEESESQPASMTSARPSCASCLGLSRPTRRRHSTTPTFLPFSHWRSTRGRHRHASDPARSVSQEEDGRRRRCQGTTFEDVFCIGGNQEDRSTGLSAPDSKGCLSPFTFRMDKLWSDAGLDASLKEKNKHEEEDHWPRLLKKKKRVKKRLGEELEDQWMKRVKLEATLTQQQTIWDLRAHSIVQTSGSPLESCAWDAKRGVARKGLKGQGRITDYFKAQAKSSLLREHCVKIGIKAEGNDKTKQEHKETTPPGLPEKIVANTVEPKPEENEFRKPDLPEPDTPIIRFPAVAQTPKADKAAASERTVEQMVCLWKTCGEVLGTSHQLLTHIERVHVQTQEGKHYSCEWEGCKVQGKKSCSANWLQRHVLSHGGSNKPFGCIVDSCEQRFSTRMALERHVNSHFNQQANGNQVTPNGSQGKKCHDIPTVKLLRRNSKKLKSRRKPATARLFDYFDAGIMERLKYQLLRITDKATALGVSLNGDVNLTSEVLAQRIGPNGNLQVLVHWTPENLLPDEWILASDLVAEKCVPIAQLGPQARVLIHEAMYGSGNGAGNSPLPGQQPAKKHRRKNTPTSYTPASLT